MTNATLSSPRGHLAGARRRLEAMRAASSLEELENEWRLFLVELNRAWTKLGKVCATAQGRASAWYGRSKHERESDALLTYLEQARHSDEHSLESSSERTGARVEFAPDPEIGSVAIRSVTIDSEGRVKYEGINPLVVTFRPGDVVIAEVKNRGVLFPVPNTHRGAEMKSARVLDIAPLALDDLERRMVEADSYFA